jgi:glycosyltransferase A (GT-A) superfamily protein (DUF2064 family)
MNKIAVICFVKTPGITPAKTRLAQDVGPEATEEIYLLLIERCKELLRELTSIKMDVFFAVNELSGLNSPIWSHYSTYLQQGNSLGEKLKYAEEFFLERYDSIFFMGSDSPSLTSNHFLLAQKNLADANHIFIPAKDGGFVLYGTKSHLSSDVWLNTIYSSSSTLSEMIARLDHFLLLDPLTDLDSLVDISSILQEMEQLPCQGDVWEKIKKTFKKLKYYLEKNTAT